MRIRRLLAVLPLLFASSSVLAQEASIMVVGDSISAGSDRPSYRMPLYNTLLSQQCQVDMVGSQTKTTFNYRSPNPNATGYHFPSFDPAQYPGYPAGAHWAPSLGDDTDHQSFPSISTNQVRDGVSGPSYTVSAIGSYVSQYQPDYVLVHLGTNDMSDAIVFDNMRSSSQINSWATTTINEVSGVVDQIFSAHSNPGNLKILLANLIPYERIFTNLPDNATASLTATTASQVFRSRLESFVANRGDSRLRIVDVASGFNNDSMTYDGIHPNRAGEVHIANRFVAALTSAGLCATNGGGVGNGVAPAITAPSVGSTLTGSSQSFTWTNNSTSVIQWFVEAGTAADSNKYFNSGRITNGSQRSVSVTGLPTDNSQVIIRLSWKIPSGAWFGANFNFTASGGNGGGTTGSTTSGGTTGSTTSGGTTGGTTDGGGTTATPTINGPSVGSVLTGSSQTFSWNNNSTSVIQWFVEVGTAANSSQYYSSGRITNGAQRSVNATGLPTNGSPVIARLSWKIPSGAWFGANFNFTAQGGSSGGTTGSTTGGTTGSTTGGTTGSTTGGTTGSTPTVNAPAVGSVLSGSSQTLSWNNNSTSVFQWFVEVGTAANSSQYYSSGRITNGAQRSVNATGLPTNGSPVIVRLSWKISSGAWFGANFNYTAANSGGGTTGSTGTTGGTTGGSTTGGTTGGSTTGSGGTGTPTVNGPSVGSVLSGSNQTFTWNNNSTSVIQWFVEVGTAADSNKYYNSGRITNASTRSVQATGLPTDGSQVIVRLSWKLPSGSWAGANFSFTAAQ